MAIDLNLIFKSTLIASSLSYRSKTEPICKYFYFLKISIDRLNKATKEQSKFTHRFLLRTHSVSILT